MVISLDEDGSNDDVDEEDEGGGGGEGGGGTSIVRVLIVQEKNAIDKKLGRIAAMGSNMQSQYVYSFFYLL